jgi:hypothetical protein
MFTHAGNPRIVLQHEAFGLASPHTVYNDDEFFSPDVAELSSS